MSAALLILKIIAILISAAPELVKLFNEIMAAIDVNDAGQIEARLVDRKKFRREWKAAYHKIRRKE